MNQITNSLLGDTPYSIFASDRSPVAGGASSEFILAINGDVDPLVLKYQHGPILENGVNGWTDEALTITLIHRLEAWQSGPYANDYNAQVLFHLKESMRLRNERTAERLARQVEGTSKV